MSDEPFKPEEKVKILLTEYTSLKSEIIARVGHGYQVSGFAVAALSLLAFQGINWRTIAVFVLIVLLLAGTGALSVRDVWRAAARVREIERDVNKRAGENLLAWETFWGDALKFLKKPPQSN